MNCPNCNAPLADDAIFCGNCGFDLRGYQPDAAPAEPAAEEGVVTEYVVDEEKTVAENAPQFDPNAVVAPAAQDVYAPQGGYAPMGYEQQGGYAAPQYDPNAYAPQGGYAGPQYDPNTGAPAGGYNPPPFDPNSIPMAEGPYEPYGEPDTGKKKPKKSKEKPQKQEQDPNKKRSFKLILIAIIAVVAIAVIALVLILVLKGGGLGGSSSKKNDYGFSKYALYLKDGELCYSDLKKDPWQVTDNMLPDGTWGRLTDSSGSSMTSYVTITEDGKTIYFPDKLRSDADDGYTLYSRPLTGEDGEIKKIDSHVSRYLVTKNGAYITYISASGTLYQYDVKKEEKNKIATEVSYFSTSKDGRTILYQNEDSTLFAVPQGKDKVKISTDVNGFKLMDDGKTIYYRKNDTLYRQVIGDDKEKIATDLYSYRVFDDGSIYYVKEDEIEIPAGDYIRDDKKGDASYDGLRTSIENTTLTGTEYTYFYYNGKEAVKLATSTVIYSSSPGSRIYIEDGPGMMVTIYQLPETKVNLSEVNLATLDSKLWASAQEDSVKMIFLKDKVTEIGHVRDAMVDDNFNIYYQEEIEKETQKDASIFKMAYSGGTYHEADEVAEDVVLDYWTVANNKLYYFTDINEKDYYYISTGDLYEDGKLIEEDVLIGSIYYLQQQGKEIFYCTEYDEKNELMTINSWNGSKSQMIAEDVHSFLLLYGEGVLYINEYSSKREEGELNWYYNGKNLLIDEDVKAIVPLNGTY